MSRLEPRLGTRWELAAFAFGLILASCLQPGVSLLHGQSPSRQTPVDSLIYDLKSPDPARRAGAARNLGSSKVRAAVPALVAAANDKDTAVRREIITALEKLSDIRALPAFEQLCGDSDKDIRERALQGIISLYLPKESGLSVTVNKVANFFNPWSDEWADVVVEPGIKVDPGAVTALSGRLQDSDESIRAKAARALGILEARSAVPALIRALHVDKSNAVRFEVIRALRKISDPSAGSELIGYIAYSDPKVRNEAVHTLGCLRCPKAVSELTRHFEAESAVPVNQRDNNYRQILLGALAFIGNSGSESLFQKEAQSDDEIIRQNAYEGLARIGDPARVTEVSRRYLAEKDPRVRISQAYALFRMGRREYLDEVVRGLENRRTSSEARQYLLELTPGDLPDLLAETRSKDVTIREGLVEVLGMIGDSRAVPVLQELSKDRRGQIAALCNQALRRIAARAEN